MLVLSRAEVEELLDLDELTDALARAHVELSAGAASMPPRIAALAGEAGLLGAMPAYLPSAGLGCKLVSLFPGNVDRPTHQAEIVVFDPERTVELGEVLAGTRPGRTNAEQLTLYKSVGVAVQDLAAAGLVLAASEARA